MGTNDAGHYTMEAWTCQTQNLVPQSLNGEFGKLCVEGKAARWLLILYVVLSFVLLGLEFWIGGKRERINPKEEGGAKSLGEAGASDD